MNEQVHVYRHTNASGTCIWNTYKIKQNVEITSNAFIQIPHQFVKFMHIHPDMNEHLYIVQTKDIVEAINVMITKKKISKINKQAIFTCIHVQSGDLLSQLIIH